LRTVVLGAGVTGLAYAKFDKDSVVYEKSHKIGGKCQTSKIPTPVGIFTFDVGGHWLHTKSCDDVRHLFSNLEEHQRQAFVTIEKDIIDYPIQQNYNAISHKQLAASISSELARIAKKDGKSFRTYKDMLYGSYGKTLCEVFFEPYNKKAFGLTDLSHIKLGKWALVRNLQMNDNKGYNDTFLYSKNAQGAQYLANELSNGSRVELEKEARLIDIANKIVYFHDGDSASYDRLVSTIPLNTLINISAGISEDIKELAKNLKASKGHILNIGLPYADFLKDKTWVYHPDDDLSFYRVGVYSNVDKGMAPEGYASIYVEVRTDDRQVTTADVLRDLAKVGYLSKDSNSVCIDHKTLNQNYCFPSENTEAILATLKAGDVYSIGRYGSWHWSSMHEDIKQAIDLSKELTR
jgi:protoporphyrinogen oxidase